MGSQAGRGVEVLHSENKGGFKYALPEDYLSGKTGVILQDCIGEYINLFLVGPELEAKAENRGAGSH